jgi:acetyl esterase/lipase
MRRAKALRLGMLAAGTVLAAATGGCSPTTVLGALQPKAAGGELTDIAYAPGPRHAMDVYIPAAGRTPPPVVVFFYGGGWTGGNRALYRFVGRSLASCGLLTIIPDYRVWPETGFPGFLEDGAAAVAAARSEAARLGGDTSRLFLMGHSAGAYIAVMLALDPEWLSKAGVDQAHALAGTIGVSGPYDFLPLQSQVLKQIFAPAGPNTQPITYAANARAPLLLMTGADDTTVLPANSLRLADRVRQAGGSAETIVHPGIGHIGAIASFARPLHFLTPFREAACSFMGVPTSGLKLAPRQTAEAVGSGTLAR